MQKYIISEYAHDAPAVIREFLVYMATIKGKSPHTAYEYYLDLRMFFRYVLHNRHLVPTDRKSTRLNSSHHTKSRMPSSA